MNNEEELKDIFYGTDEAEKLINILCSPEIELTIKKANLEE